MVVSELYMTRCLELAERGKGNVAPNPMVGAVIVHDGRIIGEGYHHCCGEAHAEVNAIASVKDKSLLRKSTLYVSLEPCSHYGKTPPCAELIIKKEIPRVVVACLDPYPEVAGRGIKMLREAGVEVITGVMEREATDLNRYFMTAHKKQRPYVILKWAQSADGFIDHIRKDATKDPAQFSTPITRMMVHKLRSEVQSVLVGPNTAILDNPSLTVRHWSGKSPVRILADRNLRVSQDFRLLDGSQRTIIYTMKDIHKSFFDKTNIEYVKMDDYDSFFQNMLTDLYLKSIHSLLVEGGACIHRCFTNEGLWNEMIIETAPCYLTKGIRSVCVDTVTDAQPVDRYEVSGDTSYCLKPSVIERFINGKDLKK